MTPVIGGGLGGGDTHLQPARAGAPQATRRRQLTGQSLLLEEVPPVSQRSRKALKEASGTQRQAPCQLLAPRMEVPRSHRLALRVAVPCSHWLLHAS